MERLLRSCTPVSIESSIGTVQIKDLDPNKPGIQVFAEGGTTVVLILAPTEAGEGVLKISAGVYETSTPVRFLVELRPMLAVGIIEGSFAPTILIRYAPAKSSTQDGFEEEPTICQVPLMALKQPVGVRHYF